MKRLTTLRVVVSLLTLLLAAGCSGGGGSGTDGEETGSNGSSETTGGSTEDRTDTAPGTTQETGNTNEAPGGVSLLEISSGSSGLEQRQVVVAPSAAALSEAAGVQVPEAGEGTYLAAFWGEKPTGGYTMEALDAQPEGDRIVVRLALKKPPPDAMVSQALTYPYVAAVIRGSVPENINFTFVTQGGRELDWPVRRL